MIQKTQHRMQENNKNSEMMKLGPHGHTHTNPLPSLIFPPKTRRILDHNSWCFKFKKELSVVPGRWFVIHDDEESGRQVAGWLAQEMMMMLMMILNSYPLLSSVLPCSRKKERKTPTPIHSLLMIIDDEYDSGPGFSFFQFYNIQTTAVYPFLLLFVVSWIVRWLLSSVSCLLMLLIRRIMRLLQNTAMYVCMYICACSSNSSNPLGFFFFCWCSSTLEARWWRSSSSTHNSESKQASKQVGPILLLLLPHFCSISAHCAGADVEFSFEDSSVENLQPNTKPISLLNSLELLYLQHSPSWTTSRWCKTSLCCKQASKQASIRVGREIIGGGELAMNLEVKLEVVFFFRGSLKCFFKYGAQKYSRIWEKTSGASSPLFPSSSLLQFHQNFTRGASSSKQQILKELCFWWKPKLSIQF